MLRGASSCYYTFAELHSEILHFSLEVMVGVRSVKYLGVKEEINQVSFVKKNSHQQVSLHSIYLSDLSPNVHTVTVRFIFFS